MSVCAADLSIPTTSLASGSSTAATSAKTSVRNANANSHAAPRTKKQQRMEKSRPPRIVAYNLFGDPVFKLPGAIDDRRQFAPLADAAGSRTGYLPSAATGMSTGGLRAGEPADDNAGIAFDCHEKPGAANGIPRRLTACYKTQTDKGWKTQTYLSKGFAASKSEWGGGVSIIYAH